LKLALAAFAGLWLISGDAAAGERVLYVLDASGSMRAPYPGGMRDRFEDAKDQIRWKLNQSDERFTQQGLLIFGAHDAGCGDIEYVVPVATSTKGRIFESVAMAGARGLTPLMAAIERAGLILKEGSPTSQGRVVVISDGIDTCSGNAVAEAKRLCAMHPGMVVSLVGLDVGPKDEAQLREIAEAFRGSFSKIVTGAAPNGGLAPGYVPELVTFDPRPQQRKVEVQLKPDPPKPVNLPKSLPEPRAKQPATERKPDEPELAPQPMFL